MILFEFVVIAIFLVHDSVEQFSSSNIEKSVKDAESLFQDFWEWKLVNNPEFATKIGVFKYDNRVNERSLSSYQRRGSKVRLFLHKLESIRKFIDVKKHPTLALNIDLLNADLEQYLSGTRFSTYVWPLNVLEGPQGDLAHLLNLMKKKTVADMSNIITRIRLFAQQINEDIALLTEGIRIGQTMHRKSFENLIPVYKKISVIEVGKNPFSNRLKKKRKTFQLTRGIT